MSKLLFKITETFSINNLGLIAATDIKEKDVKVFMNQIIIVKRPDGSEFESRIAGIPMLTPYNPERSFSFSFPKDLEKNGVPIGSEIWTVE